MRVRQAFGLVFACGLAACGSSKSNNTNNPDAGRADAGPPTNVGFTLPTKGTHANMSTTSGSTTTWTDLGPADWTCLGTASTDAPLAANMTLTGQVVDFMNMQNGIPSASIDVFDDNGAQVDYTAPFQTITADTKGNFTVTIPSGKTHVGFKVTAANYFDTFLLNQYWSPSSTANTISVGDISQSLATALPAFIDFDRADGTGVLAGAMRDCSDHEVSNAIATVSSTSMQPDHLQGTVTSDGQQVQVIASTFYFNVNTGLPAKHSDEPATDQDGLFTILNLPPLATGTNGYIQVWGFKTDGDVANGMAGLTLLAELPSPVLADNVITGSIVPLRAQ